MLYTLLLGVIISLPSEDRRFRVYWRDLPKSMCESAETTRPADIADYVRRRSPYAVVRVTASCVPQATVLI